MEMIKFGLTVDPETGEISEDDFVAIPDRFEVTDITSAEWVLDKMQCAEADIAAAQLRIDTVLDNLRSIKRRHEARLAHLHGRFDADLRAWAERELAGKRERTVSTAFGKLAFRKVALNVRLAEGAVEDAAIEWAKTNAPGAVITKISERLSMPSLKSAAAYSELPADLFEIVPEHDNFSVTTLAGAGGSDEH